MKNLRKVAMVTCVAALVTSCSEPDHQETATTGVKTAAAKTSATTKGYWKDDVTTVTSINVTPGYQRKVLYSIGPIDVKTADVISAHLQQELTFSGNNNAMVGSGILLATSATAVSNTSAGFIGWVARPATSNLSYSEEVSLEVFGRNGSYKFANDINGVYVNAICYAASSASLPDLTVPAGNYGELVAVLEEGVTWNAVTTTALPFNAAEGKYSVPHNAAGVLYRHNSYGPVTLPAGTMVDVRFDVEATSETPAGSNQYLGRAVVQGTAASSTGGLSINKQIMGGITQPEHHWTTSHAGGAYYPSGVTNAYFNSVLYCKGTYSGQPLYIEGPTANAYGHFIVETRPYVGFYQDISRNVSSISTAKQVVYSVGPINIAANQVVEIRYQAAFQPSGGALAVDSEIRRVSSPTATTGGTLVQRPLVRRFHPNYGYNNIVLSTAERPATAQTGVYYNVIVWKLNGTGSATIPDWGELEVVKR